MVRLLAKALSEGDEVVASGFQLLDGVRDDFLRSCHDGVVVQGEDVAGMGADNVVIPSLALLGGEADGIAGASKSLG